MSKLVRLVGAILLVGVATFCVYGYLSAPEAGASAGSVRLLYGAIGGASVIGTAWLAWPRRP